MLITQTFLPLLTSSPPLHPHHHPQQPAPKPSVLLLTPSIIQSLNPAFHAPESVLVSGLSSFAAVLRSELSPLGIPVCHLQLGSFDTSSTHSRQHQNTQQSQRAETLKWDDTTRQNYGRNFVALSTGLGNAGKGSSLRTLNNAVFDAMVSGTAQTIRVGMGAKLYGFVGNWVPTSLVGWMMGQRGVEIVNDASGMFGRLIGNGDEAASEGLGSPILRGSRSTSPGSFGDSEYVYTERE